MKTGAWLLAGLVVAAAIALQWRAAPRTPPPADPAFAQTLRAHARVILVTLDGPRRDDVLEGPHLRGLQDAVATEGVALEAKTASVLAGSLTGYQALAVGALTTCRDNDCPRVKHETVAERLARALQLPPEQVAVFASWARVRRAASARDGAVFVDAPREGPRRDGGPPWRDARFDEETFERARAHWLAHRPRFLHLAFLDTDEWAHRGLEPEYARALRETDARLLEVLRWVDALPADEAALTTLIVTADHGRSRHDWRQHGFFKPGSRDVFVIAVGPLVQGGRERRVDQTDVRPTIERLFGLCPEGATGEGHALASIVGALPCLP